MDLLKNSIQFRMYCTNPGYKNDWKTQPPFAALVPGISWSPGLDERWSAGRWRLIMLYVSLHRLLESSTGANRFHPHSFSTCYSSCADSFTRLACHPSVTRLAGRLLNSSRQERSTRTTECQPEDNLSPDFVGICVLNIGYVNTNTLCKHWQRHRSTLSLFDASWENRIASLTVSLSPSDWSFGMEDGKICRETENGCD